MRAGWGDPISHLGNGTDTGRPRQSSRSEAEPGEVVAWGGEVPSDLQPTRQQKVLGHQGRVLPCSRQGPPRRQGAPGAKLPIFLSGSDLSVPGFYLADKNAASRQALRRGVGVAAACPLPPLPVARGRGEGCLCAWQTQSVEEALAPTPMLHHATPGRDGMRSQTAGGGLPRAARPGTRPGPPAGPRPASGPARRAPPRPWWCCGPR